MQAVQLPADADATLIYGVAGSAVACVSWEQLLERRPPVAVLVASRTKALEAWAGDLQFFAKNTGTHISSTGTHVNGTGMHVESIDTRAKDTGTHTRNTGTHTQNTEAHAKSTATPAKSTRAPAKSTGTPAKEPKTPLPTPPTLRFYLLPEPESEATLDDPRAFERGCDRLATLTALNRLREEGANAGEILCLLATPAALGAAMPAPAQLQARQLRLRVGQTHSFDALVQMLPAQLGYDHEALCESPGQYAVRGGLIDVYPLNAEAPVRIDFFGDEIDSIRTFDPTSQRSDASSHLSEVTIAPASELGNGSAAAGEPAGGNDRAAAPRARKSYTVLDYLPDSGICWHLREPAALVRLFPDHLLAPENIAPPPSNFVHIVNARSTAKDAQADARQDAQAKARKAPAAARSPQTTATADHWLGLCLLDEDAPLFAHAARIERDSESLEAYAVHSETKLLGIARVELEQGARTRLFEQLDKWQRGGNALHLIARTEAELARLKDVLAEDPAGRALRPQFHIGELEEGFRIGGAIAEDSRIATAKDFSARADAPPRSAPANNAPPPAAQFPPAALPPATLFPPAVYVTEAEIFGRKRLRIGSARQRRLPERKAVEQALDFSELVDGDHLVHLQNGICIFRGLQKLELKGRQEEVITLEFDEGVHLHLRLHDSHLLSRYVGLSKVSPRLGKLGTNSWEKARAGAERATLDFAAELLRLQAERDALPGFAFPEDTPWQHEFEAAFPFTETVDQLKAINDTKADMQREHPMDRLICGDVGFGKTEIAIRAAFKAVQAGKQVALMIPTTVLCLQHFRTFKERFADYPVVVEMLNRFRTPKQRTEIARQLKMGRIDIIVGTHALLAKSVQFRDLGLLIVDEEHRFGVRQKEQLKQLKKDVDVVSMSATPIPRTLYFALMGARDLSVIETPPRERRPIETIVKAYDPQLVKNAILSELDRGGQVFYLHNRVHTIDAVADNLRKLIPTARIGVGHGQMAEGELEKLMADFVDGRYDVLVCTTIIESGLDIPNCNTILIEGADRFGLSQLYQLRGRVGRFNRQAYCYLLLHRHGNLLDIARKRLGAIRQYNQLGAGYRIAMRDLELRGAGNLLGSKQHGPIATVGFDLYCQLLRQSVARLKGESPARLIRAVVRLDFVVVGEATEDTAPMQARYGMRPEDSVLPAERGRNARHHGDSTQQHGTPQHHSSTQQHGSTRHPGSTRHHSGKSQHHGDSAPRPSGTTLPESHSGALARISGASHNFDKFRESSEVKTGYQALRASDKQARSVRPVEAYLPVGYIGETRLRIDFYRRLAQADSEQAVHHVAEQMADRFGPLPQPVEALLQWTQIRVVAERKGIILVQSDAERLKCQLAKSGAPQFIKVGDRFPRLTAGSALSRMREILSFLKRQNDI